MLKIIAILTMLIDHIGRVFFPDNLILMIIGRVSFPLFCWFITTGISYTKNIYNYATRVFVLAVISQIPYHLLFTNHNFNVCFTLFFGIIIIIICNSKLSIYVKSILVSIIFFIPDFLHFDYGSYGIATIILMYFLKNKFELLLLSYTAISILAIQIYHYETLQLYAIVSISLIIFIRNDKLRIKRIFNYSFYPIHLFILFLISFIKF